MELDRNALLVYLSNLRILETVIHESNQKNNELDKKVIEINAKKKEYENECNRRIGSPPPSLESIVEEGKLGCLYTGMLMFGILALVDAFFCLVDGESGFFSGFFRFMSIFVFIPVGILMFYLPIRKKINAKAELKNYQFNVDRYHEKLEREKENKIQFFASQDEQINNIYQSKSKIRAEIQQFKMLLEHAYSLNVIPLQFRNVQGIYYLYDYISTSYETLTTALLQANLESIKQKLDKMIELQGALIIQQAQANQIFFEQNNMMLSSLWNAEQYSKIAAINSELSVRMQAKQLAFQAADFLLK